jgi:hypothetical protein
MLFMLLASGFFFLCSLGIFLVAPGNDLWFWSLAIGMSVFIITVIAWVLADETS